VGSTRKMAALRESGPSPPTIFSQLLAPWAKFYRPLGGLPGPPGCCRRKLSQIRHATAAGLPVLCRTPSGRVLAVQRPIEQGSHLSPIVPTPFPALSRRSRRRGKSSTRDDQWMGRCDIPGMVSVLAARAEPGQLKECLVRA
jgi:hypothetical protein